MGIKNVGEKYDIPSAIRCDTLNIDTTGTVDISAAIEPPPLAHLSDSRWYYYAYTPLYSNRTSEAYGFNVINAGRITLKAKDSNWLFNKDQLAEDHKDGIYEYICDSIRAKEGWTVTETAAGTDTPYILQFTSPTYVEPDSHPFTVGSLENEMGYYVSGQTDLVNVAPGTVLGSSVEAKWNNFTKQFTKAVGWIYYDRETGTAYVKGEVGDIAYQSSTDTDHLTVIVDGDATISNPIYDCNDIDLEKLTISFRRNATLTLEGKAYSGSEPSAKGILDVGYGDLELNGTGMLKIVAPDYSEHYFGLCAYDVSILDNVSLDIRMGSLRLKETGESSAAISCFTMNINTTGTVCVDTSQKISSGSMDNFGYFDAISFRDKEIFQFNLVKAQKVRLTSRSKLNQVVDHAGLYMELRFGKVIEELQAKGWVLTQTEVHVVPYVWTFTDPNNRPAPDVVKSYTANAGLNETALRQGQAKFTWVEIYSDRDTMPTDETYNEMTATMKCEIVDADIAKKIGYNSGDPAVTSEDQLYDLKVKLSNSKMYHAPSDKTLDLATAGNMMHPYKLGKGTFRYLLSVEAYFNDTYYFDGAGIAFEEGYSGKMTPKGTTNNYVAAMTTGVIMFPDTDSGLGDPPTKLKLVIDNVIGREFTRTNIAPMGNDYLKDYPDKYVANFRWINMPNTDLDIELRKGTVLHVGKYFSNAKKDPGLANIYVDNLTIGGSGVLLASIHENAFNQEKRTAGAAIKANSVTVNSGNVALDLKRDADYNCISVPTPSAFRPINAQSVQLAAKDGRWVAGLLNNEDHMQRYYGTYWDDFTIEKYQASYNSELDMVTFGHTRATLSDPVFNLGGTDYQKNAVIPDYVMGSGNDKFSISFTLGPKWAKMLCNSNQIKSNAEIEIWKDGVYLGKQSVAEQYNYSYEDVVEYTLLAENFALEAGHVYRVYAYMCPYTGSTNLAEGKGVSWTFYVCGGANDTNTISQVALQQLDGDISTTLYTGTPGDRNSIAVTSNSKYSLTSQGDWYGTFNGHYPIAGNQYTKTVTLQAKGNYRFRQYCDVTVDAKSTEVVRAEASADRKTLTIYLEATCVTLLRTASGTLTGFYQGMDVWDAKVISAEPDKYDIEIVYIGNKYLDGTMSEPTWFQKDDDYAFGLKVVPKAGYEFLETGYGTVNLTVKMDENYHSDIQTVTTSFKTSQQVGTVSYSGKFFETVEQCWAPPQTFDRLDITISNPVAGKSAAECPESFIIAQKDFSVLDLQWSTINGGGTFTGTFQDGVTYSCDFWVEYPWYMEPSSDYTVYVNGEEAWNVYFDTVIVPGKTIIAVNQRMTAVGDGVMLSGLVNSFGSSSDDVTIQLIADGTSEAAYETIVQGNSAIYSFSGVLSGDYTMRVMKKNHVTREYAVSIGAINARQDVQLYLWGDFDCDGAVKISDVVLLSRYVAQDADAKAPSEQGLLNADCVKDGSIDSSDITAITRYLAHLIDASELGK